MESENVYNSDNGDLVISKLKNDNLAFIKYHANHWAMMTCSIFELNTLLQPMYFCFTFVLSQYFFLKEKLSKNKLIELLYDTARHIKYLV